MGYRLRGQERYRPFFIIGAARSGNTLLRRVLYAHPEIHIPPETFVLRAAIRKFAAKKAPVTSIYCSPRSASSVTNRKQPNNLISRVAIALG